MMTALDTILTILGTGTISTLTTWLITRRKQRAETDQVIQEVANKVLAMVDTQLQRTNDEMKRLVLESEVDKKKISSLEAEVRTVQAQHEDCELNNSLLSMELEGLRKLVEEKTIPLGKVRVAVLDDNEIDTYLFAQRLGRISLLEVKTFTKVDPFMEEIATRPEVLILDYHLGKGLTIEAFLKKIYDQPGYDPKVVIITGDESPAVRETMTKMGVWRFFLKRGPYINQVTKQIMDYLDSRVT